MSMLELLADVSPDAATRPFWDACRRRELRLQRCSDCGAFRQPPSAGCPHCGCSRCDWPLLSGRGTVFSYTIVHHAAVPPLAATISASLATLLSLVLSDAIVPSFGQSVWFLYYQIFVPATHFARAYPRKSLFSVMVFVYTLQIWVSGMLSPADC